MIITPAHAAHPSRMVPKMDDQHSTVSESGSIPSDGAKAAGRRRRVRLTVIVVGAVALVLVLVAGGAFAWVSFTFSKANHQPGVEEARKALQTVSSTEPLPALAQSILAREAG